jgi:hypothetical protein
MPAPHASSSLRQAGFAAPRVLAAPTGGDHPARASSSSRQSQSGDGSSAQEYCWPAPAARAPQRAVCIPASFGSSQEYAAVLRAAVVEEVNLQLADKARCFFNLLQQQQNQQQQQQQQQQQGCRSGSTPQQQPPAQQTMLSRLQGACSRAGLHFHPGSTLTVYHNSSSKRGGGRRQGPQRTWGAGRAAEGDDDAGDDGAGDDPDEQQQRKPLSMYLTLSGKLDRRQFRCVWGGVCFCGACTMAGTAESNCASVPLNWPRVHCRKHDLWVLSCDALLGAGAAAAGADGGGRVAVGRQRLPWVVVARCA